MTAYTVLYLKLFLFQLSDNVMVPFPIGQSPFVWQRKTRVMVAREFCFGNRTMRGFFGSVSEKKRREGTKEEEKKGDFKKVCTRETINSNVICIWTKGVDDFKTSGKKNKTSIKLGFKANLSTSSKEES